MEYDRSDSFPFAFEPNGIPFGSKSKGNLLKILNEMELYLFQNQKENCHHDHISFNLKVNRDLFFSEVLNIYSG